MVLENTAVTAQKSNSKDIFARRISFNTYLMMNGDLLVKRSAKQKLPFLENNEGVALWLGKNSIQSKWDFTTTSSCEKFADELASNARAYEIGITHDGNFIVYAKGESSAETMAVIKVSRDEKVETVATVKG
jgi:hypothetical protein